jgi:hypothetical protein
LLGWDLCSDQMGGGGVRASANPAWPCTRCGHPVGNDGIALCNTCIPKRGRRPWWAFWRSQETADDHARALVTRRPVRWDSRDDEWVIPVELERAISSAAVAEAERVAERRLVLALQIAEETLAEKEATERALEEAREAIDDLAMGAAIFGRDDGSGQFEELMDRAREYIAKFQTREHRALVSTESRLAQENE